MAINDEYLIVKGNADDSELEQYRLCFENNGSPRDLSNLQWLHQQNPTKKNSIYYAMAGPRVAAIYTAIPVFFLIAGQQVLALQSIDTMTDAEHRGKGLFPKLANKLYADAPENNVELVYGFPNENSAPGFFNKLKWISFGEAPFLLKPIRVSYFLKKLLKQDKSLNEEAENVFFARSKKVSIKPGVEIIELDSFDEAYQSIWRQASQKTLVAVDRSATYMNWRYADKPGENYSKYGLYINGTLTGIIVFTIKNKHGGRIGYIMELIYNNDNSETGHILLKFASAVFKKQKTDAALAWCFPHSFNFKAFKKAGYYNLPVRFRPQHLFLGTRAFNDQNAALINDVNNWYISYSDSDTV